MLQSQVNPYLGLSTVQLPRLRVSEAAITGRGRGELRLLQEKLQNPLQLHWEKL